MSDKLTQRQLSALCMLQYIQKMKHVAIGSPPRYYPQYHLPQSINGTSIGWKDLWLPLYRREYIEATDIGGFSVSIGLTTKGKDAIKAQCPFSGDH